MTYEPKLGIWDFVAIAGYFAAVIGAGLFVSSCAFNSYFQIISSEFAHCQWFVDAF